MDGGRGDFQSGSPTATATTIRGERTPRVTATAVCFIGSVALAWMAVWAFNQTSPTSPAAGVFGGCASVVLGICGVRTFRARLVVSAGWLTVFGATRTRRLPLSSVRDVQIAPGFGGPSLFLLREDDRRHVMVPLAIQVQRLPELTRLRGEILDAMRA